MMIAVRSTRSFYDRVSGAYDLLSDASEHRARERGVELLDPAPETAALEIGFGTGHSLLDLAQRLGPRGRVRGLDPSKGMARVAIGRLKKEPRAERAPVELLLGDARRLPFVDSTFDVAFASFTLELFGEEIPTVLGEIERVLRPGGRLGIVSMLEREHEGAMVSLYRWFHRHFPHIVDCEPIPVERRLEQARFEIESFEQDSIWGLPVAMAVAAPRSRAR
jgi:demethylmenaquinone methyltransferase/2-methoxy-6-polyprenyl-1,4-benzoquinol methylase